MALIVETGSGVAEADSYLSLVDARALAEKYGITLPADDTEAEVLLRNGYLGLITIEPQLQGYRTHDIQTNIYPRTGVYKNCVAVGADSIPNEVKLSQLYQADAIQSGASTNGVVSGQKLKSFSVDGVYSETYQDGSSASLNAVVQGVQNQMYPLTKVGYQQSPCGGGGYGNGLGRESMGYLR